MPAAGLSAIGYFYLRGVGSQVKFTKVYVRPLNNIIVPTDEAARRCYESKVKNGDLRLGLEYWNVTGHSDSKTTDGYKFTRTDTVGGNPSRGFSQAIDV